MIDAGFSMPGNVELRLLIAPEHRGQGLGTNLVGARMSWGYEQVRVWHICR